MFTKPVFMDEPAEQGSQMITYTLYFFCNDSSIKNNETWIQTYGINFHVELHTNHQV